MPIVIDGRFTKDKKRSSETAPYCSHSALTAFCAPVTQAAHGLTPLPFSRTLFLPVMEIRLGINDIRLQMEKPGRSAGRHLRTTTATRRRVARSTDSGA